MNFVIGGGITGLICAYYTGYTIISPDVGGQLTKSKNLMITFYLHARAHIKALNLNESDIFNLGTESGTTVLELIKNIEKQKNIKIKYSFGKRRAGDPAVILASNKKAKGILL